MMSKTFLIFFAVIAVFALFLRVPGLENRPLHHDEANQAFKFQTLLEDGEYKYDPKEHHGPTLYFLTLPFAWMTSGTDFSELSTTTLRAVPLFFGILTLFLLLAFHGAMPSRALAFTILLTAVSPALTYYSRFYIQETLLVFFTLGIIISGYRYVQTGKLYWAISAGVAAGLVHATKETSIIVFFALLVGAAGVYFRHRPDSPDIAGKINIWGASAGLIAFGIVVIVFYSSFFTYAEGPLDSILTYKTYFLRGAGETLHNNPWYFYFEIFLWGQYGAGPIFSEAFIFVLGIIGMIWAFRNKHAFGEFLSIMTIVITVVYSGISHKTPWSGLTILMAFVLLAGFGAHALLENRVKILQALAAVFIAVGSYHLYHQNIRANGRFASDPRNPYVYSQTAADFKRLVRRIEDLSAVHPDGKNMLIHIVADPHDYWPLPWYLRKYSNVGYWSSAEHYEHRPPAPVLYAAGDEKFFLEAKLPEWTMEFYGLRPGTLASLHIEKSLWKSFLDTR